MKLNCEIRRKHDSFATSSGKKKTTKQNIYEEKRNLFAFMANWQTDKYKKYL